jgi:hypothetical protein
MLVQIQPAGRAHWLRAQLGVVVSFGWGTWTIYNITDGFAFVEDETVIILTKLSGWKLYWQNKIVTYDARNLTNLRDVY